ncbi:MAG: CPBP family intramembrane metalloprotease [Clostridia bacterium]|nr:CPBP family intramembrane metalloprotease [Clostridia bacterium]
MRTALLLAFAALAAMGVSALLDLLLPPLPPALDVVVDALTAIMILGSASYLGLYVIDGRHEELIRRRVLSPAQILWYSAMGPLLVAPVTLLQDVLASIVGMTAQTYGQADPSLFLLQLVSSVLLVPALEEIFFRGYLHSALGYGWKGMVYSAGVFALMHADMLYLPRFLFALLASVVMLKADSILAPMIMHAGYNLTILLLTYMGLDGLFTGLTVISCALRVGLTLAFIYALRRAWTARVVRLKFDLPDISGRGGISLTRREILLLCGAAIAVLLAVVTTGVLA